MKRKWFKFVLQKLLFKIIASFYIILLINKASYSSIIVFTMFSLSITTLKLKFKLINYLFKLNLFQPNDTVKLTKDE